MAQNTGYMARFEEGHPNRAQIRRCVRVPETHMQSIFEAVGFPFDIRPFHVVNGKVHGISTVAGLCSARA